jgi:ATP-dependent exoDNAse (exonuclease V) alpha subunit
MDADVQSLTSSRDTYYVALSRARREARIYTNDRERLPEIMARENVKEAALEIHRSSESEKKSVLFYPPQKERDYQ